MIPSWSELAPILSQAEGPTLDFKGALYKPQHNDDFVKDVVASFNSPGKEHIPGYSLIICGFIPEPDRNDPADNGFPLSQDDAKDMDDSELMDSLKEKLLGTILVEGFKVTDDDNQRLLYVFMISRKTPVHPVALAGQIKSKRKPQYSKGTILYRNGSVTVGIEPFEQQKIAMLYQQRFLECESAPCRYEISDTEAFSMCYGFLRKKYRGKPRTALMINGGTSCSSLRTSHWAALWHYFSISVVFALGGKLPDELNNFLQEKGVSQVKVSSKNTAFRPFQRIGIEDVVVVQETEERIRKELPTFNSLKLSVDVFFPFNLCCITEYSLAGEIQEACFSSSVSFIMSSCSVRLDVDRLTEVTKLRRPLTPIWNAKVCEVLQVPANTAEKGTCVAVDAAGKMTFFPEDVMSKLENLNIEVLVRLQENRSEREPLEFLSGKRPYNWYGLDNDIPKRNMEVDYVHQAVNMALEPRLSTPKSRFVSVLGPACAGVTTIVRQAVSQLRNDVVVLYSPIGHHHDVNGSQWNDLLDKIGGCVHSKVVIILDGKLPSGRIKDIFLKSPNVVLVHLGRHRRARVQDISTITINGDCTEVCISPKLISIDGQNIRRALVQCFAADEVQGRNVDLTTCSDVGDIVLDLMAVSLSHRSVRAMIAEALLVLPIYLDLHIIEKSLCLVAVATLWAQDSDYASKFSDGRDYGPCADRLLGMGKFASHRGALLFLIFCMWRTDPDTRSPDSCADWEKFKFTDKLDDVLEAPKVEGMQKFLRIVWWNNEMNRLDFFKQVFALRRTTKEGKDEKCYDLPVIFCDSNPIAYSTYKWMHDKLKEHRIRRDDIRLCAHVVVGMVRTFDPSQQLDDVFNALQFVWNHDEFDSCWSLSDYVDATNMIQVSSGMLLNFFKTHFPDSLRSDPNVQEQEQSVQSIYDTALTYGSSVKKGARHAKKSDDRFKHAVTSPIKSPFN